MRRVEDTCEPAQVSAHNSIGGRFLRAAGNGEEIEASGVLQYGQEAVSRQRGYGALENFEYVYFHPSAGTKPTCRQGKVSTTSKFGKEGGVITSISISGVDLDGLIRKGEFLIDSISQSLHCSFLCNEKRRENSAGLGNVLVRGGKSEIGNRNINNKKKKRKRERKYCRIPLRREVNVA